MLGNWGCGVFGGDRSLKSILQVKQYFILYNYCNILQLMAATAAGRNVVYFTYMDETFGNKLLAITQLVNSNNVSIGIPL
jgi:hypothetical protein